MRKQTGVLLYLFIAFTGGGLKADPGVFTAAEFVGSIHGNANACKGIMPDAVRIGIKDVNVRVGAEGFDWTAEVDSDDYKRSYHEAVDRIRSRSDSRRRTSCEWHWGEYIAKAKPRADTDVSRNP